MSSYLSQQFKYMIIHIFICIIHHLRVYWLDSSVGQTGSRFAASFDPCRVLLTVLSCSPLPFLNLLCEQRQSATALLACCQSEKFCRQSRRFANGFALMAREVISGSLAEIVAASSVVWSSQGFHKKSSPLHHLGLFTNSSAHKPWEASSAGFSFVSTLLHWFGSEYPSMDWTPFATKVWNRLELLQIYPWTTSLSVQKTSGNVVNLSWERSWS